MIGQIKKNLISLPSNVYIEFGESGYLTITGLLGTFRYELNKNFNIVIFCNFLYIQYIGKNKFSKKTSSYLGTIYSIILNAIKGVNVGYQKKVLVNGIGYKASVENKNLVLKVGSTHKNIFLIPENLNVTIYDAVQIIITGIDNQEIGNFIAKIIRCCPLDSYQGKGLYIEHTKIKLKEIKKKQ